MEQVSSTFPFQDGLLHFCPVSTRQQTNPPPESDHINNPMLVFDDLLIKESNDYYYHNNNHNISDGQLEAGLQEKVVMKNPNDNNNYYNNNNQPPPPPERKIMRRDVERQRRKEMGGLYKSLVTLIPYEYIKGKRSTSDRLQETVRYVRDLKKRVENMRARRDELKGTTTTTIMEPAAVITTITSSSSSSSLLLMKQKSDHLHQDECKHDVHNDENGDDDDDDDDDEMSKVIVKPCSSGVEITLSVNRADKVSISKILNVLVCQGMSVNACSSVKLNQRLLLTIQAEVVGEGTVDPTQVEQQLSGLVHPNNNNNNINIHND